MCFKEKLLSVYSTSVKTKRSVKKHNPVYGFYIFIPKSLDDGHKIDGFIF